MKLIEKWAYIYAHSRIPVNHVNNHDDNVFSAWMDYRLERCGGARPTFNRKMKASSTTLPCIVTNSLWVFSGKKMIDSPQLVSGIVLVVHLGAIKWGNVCSVAKRYESWRCPIWPRFISQPRLKTWFAIVSFLRLISNGVLLVKVVDVLPQDFMSPFVRWPGDLDPILFRFDHDPNPNVAHETVCCYLFCARSQSVLNWRSIPYLVVNSFNIVSTVPIMSWKL